MRCKNCDWLHKKCAMIAIAGERRSGETRKNETPNRHPPFVMIRLRQLLTFVVVSWSTAIGAESIGNAFFPFCIDWHGSQKRTFTQQAEMLKELGYPGVGHIWLDKVEERLASLDAVGLRLFQITMQVDLAPGRAPYDAAR